MPAISFLPFLQNIPLGTKVITAVLLLASSAGIYVSTLAAQNSPHPGLIGSQLPYLLLVPGQSWKFPWVLLTAGFIELSLLELVSSAISFFLAARYLERIWGFKELCRFSAVVIVGSNLIALGFSWIVYFIFGSQDALEGLPYHGMSGLQVGFLVAFTQLIPEHQLQLFGRLKLRVKTLPGIYLLVSNVLVILLGPSPYMLVQFGFFVSWAYLRFFKLSENGDIRGDRSETFAFQYWFPPPVRPYIAAAGNKVFSVATKVGLVQSWDEPVGGGAYQVLPGPGGARAEAERRRRVFRRIPIEHVLIPYRALALKALDARLASGSPAPAAAAGPSSAAAPPAASTEDRPASSEVAVEAAAPQVKAAEEKIEKLKN